MLMLKDSLEELILHDNFFAHLDRKEKVQIILDNLQLQYDYISYLEKHNLGKDNPYHNLEHCYTIAIRSVEGAIVNSASTIDQRRIFLSALFHDFNHSAGKLTDNQNISLAVEGLQQFFNIELDNHSDKELFGENALSEMEKIIQVTEYPFIHEPKTLLEKIIRDSDLMQYLEVDYEKFMNGLGEELNLNITKEQTKDFILSQKTYTDWGSNTLKNLFKEQSHKKLTI